MKFAEGDNVASFQPYSKIPWGDKMQFLVLTLKQKLFVFKIMNFFGQALNIHSFPEKKTEGCCVTQGGCNLKKTASQFLVRVLAAHYKPQGLPAIGLDKMANSVSGVQRWQSCYVFYKVNKTVLWIILFRERAPQRPTGAWESCIVSDTTRKGYLIGRRSVG